MSEERKPRLPSREAIGALVAEGAVCLELGVAEGEFADRFLRANPHVGFLYGVDRYTERGHDTAEYARTIRRLERFRQRHALLRMSFEEALAVFEDASLDLIYIDGYAHTGQEEGRTLKQWWPKLRPGGVFAGDDYSEKWPKVVSVVDAFAQEHGLQIGIAGQGEKNTRWSAYPTWYAIKPGAPDRHRTALRLVEPSQRTGRDTDTVCFEDLVDLFACDNRNRRVIRQNLDEAALTWRTVRETDGDVLQIGRGIGGTTCLLAGAASGRKVVSVEDGIDLAEEASQKIEHLSLQGCRIELVDGHFASVELNGAKFGCAYVSGIRSREGFLTCLSRLWEGLVSANGNAARLIVHNAAANTGLAHEARDNHFPEVEVACDALVAAGSITEIAVAGSTRVFQKTGPLPETGPVQDHAA